MFVAKMSKTIMKTISVLIVLLIYEHVETTFYKPILFDIYIIYSNFHQTSETFQKRPKDKYKKNVLNKNIKLT